MRVKNKTLEIIRGDNEELNIYVEDIDGQIKDEKFLESDTIRFAVKKHFYDKNYLIYKKATIKDGVAIIKIVPEDTQNITPDRYVYDIELKRENGYTKTIVPISIIYIRGDICNEDIN